MTPSWLMMPARYISAMTSMMPEPQMPVTPVRRDRRGEAGLIRPQVRADDLEFRPRASPDRCAPARSPRARRAGRS